MAYNHQASGQYQPLYDNTYMTPHYSPPAAATSKFSEQGYDNYADPSVKSLEEQDANMKYRIRVLRFVSRVIAVFLSIAVVVPIAMTVVKYLETRNTTHSGQNDGEQPIWPSNTNTTYTYTYFGVSVVSFLLNAAIVISYCHGVSRANTAATVETVWSTVVIVAHVSIWIAGVVFYRYGKHKVNGKWEDVWGYTCSKTAEDLQQFVKDIHFAKYCNIQNGAYYAGLVQVGASILTAIIYIFMFMRMRTKKRLQNYQLDDAKEPLRHS